MTNYYIKRNEDFCISEEEMTAWWETADQDERELCAYLEDYIELKGLELVEK